MQEDGLGLIVGGVRHERDAGAALAGGPREEVVAGAAACLFQRLPRLLGQCGNVGAFGVEGDAEPVAEAGDVGGVGAAFVAAQAVVEVGGLDVDAGLLAEGRGGVEEADGVGAAGDAGDCASRLDKGGVLIVEGPYGAEHAANGAVRSIHG